VGFKEMCGLDSSDSGQDAVGALVKTEISLRVPHETGNFSITLTIILSSRWTLVFGALSYVSLKTVKFPYNTVLLP
jgi:hypothetical protein